MVYELKNCRTGARENERKTTVEITEKDGMLTFTFTAENSKYYCPYKEYNKIHSDGDVCEILIGTDPNRKVYYEIEISPHNGLMLAKMTYGGEDEDGPILDIDFVEKPFVKTRVLLRDNGYVATATFPKEAIKTGEGEIYFNAYRIDTVGGKLLEPAHLLYALSPTMRGKFHTPAYYVWLKDYLKK
ncbi:MAG: hypothetical protein E7352_02800 [Clostridiales bacterium]|nr:hypothetical protein [Clostridiales bacterium]